MFIFVLRYRAFFNRILQELYILWNGKRKSKVENIKLILAPYTVFRTVGLFAAGIVLSA